MPDRDELNHRIRAAFAANRPPGRAGLDEDGNFFEAGYDSARLTAVLATLAGQGTELALVDVFRYPTLRALSAEAASRAGLPERPAGGTGRALPWETGSRP
ncbi:acyl carrier protein [Streptomyces sp. NPDC006435]|uniref:acyl carrier protein n=1 Tax=Streptomyces sp. NPDC006435 TaxID=3154300 RepID=UPI0033B044E6